MVVLDVMMPRLSGTDVVVALREDEATKRLPVILVSARAHDEDVQRGLEAGADAYLPKPFSAQELTDLVGRMLEAN